MRAPLSPTQHPQPPWMASQRRGRGLPPPPTSRKRRGRETLWLNHRPARRRQQSISRRMSPAWRIVPFINSSRAFIGLLFTYICSSIGLFMAVKAFLFRRYFSLSCHGCAHRQCCGPNPQCGPQSHIVGTRHNAIPQDPLALWSYSLSPLLGTLSGDLILPTWHPICVHGRRSQTKIGLDRTVEAGRPTFVTRHRA